MGYCESATGMAMSYKEAERKFTSRLSREFKFVIPVRGEVALDVESLLLTISLRRPSLYLHFSSHRDWLGRLTFSLPPYPYCQHRRAMRRLLA
jgi:hypothetical protein